MRRRNHKSFFLLLLAVFFAGGLTGCADDPEARDAKEMRNRTAEAIQLSTEKDEHKEAQEKVMSVLETNRSRGVTKDAALLASGSLAMAEGQRLQSDLGMRSFQCEQDVDALERAIRSSERLLLEKERIEQLLKTDDEMIAELQKILEGKDSQEGLNKQLEFANADMDKLLSQKELVLTGKDHTQSILDEYHSNADDLMRQAELTKGDRRLELEKQAFAILEQRKEYYTKVQAAENELSLLNSDIALVQVRVDGLTASIQDIQGQIDAIHTSQAHVVLRQQMQELQQSIAAGQDRLARASEGVNTGCAEYHEMSKKICAVYDRAITEFTNVASRDVDFMATVQSADSAQYAALAMSALVKTQKCMADRLQALLNSTEQQFQTYIQNQLPVIQIARADDAKKAFEYFDQSIAGYTKAQEAVVGLFGSDRSKKEDIECRLLKSQLLALHSKMQLADLIEAFDLANATEIAMDEVIEKGQQVGVCFTQSEAMRVVENEGLGYFPLLPLDMQAFISGQKQELSEWKRLPVSEREAAVDANLQTIDDLTAEYGQDVASQLESLKQEMLSAKERGFKEPATGGNGMYGEPNSL